MRKGKGIGLKLLSGAIMIVSGTMGMQAQLHESIEVEGKYIPEIIKAERINVLPMAVNFSLPVNPLDYETGGVAASFRPLLYTMPATAWNATKDFSRKAGYLEFGIGSWLNSTLSAGYRFVDNATTLAGIKLQFNSTSLWKPGVERTGNNARQESYDGMIGLFLSHNLKDKGRLYASIDYEPGYFNYYGVKRDFPVIEGEPDLNKVPTQTFTGFGINLDWKSAIRPQASIIYEAGAGVRYTGYRSLPLPESINSVYPKGNRETDLKLHGKVNIPWDNGSSFGIDGLLEFLFYSGEQELFSYISEVPVKHETFFKRPSDYGVLGLTPYYSFKKGLLDIRLGVDIYLTFNARNERKKYSLFHIAPDMRFSYRKSGVGVYLDIMGGQELNTLMQLRQNDYYTMPALTATTPVYSPFDATFGACFGPFSGFSIEAALHYKVSNNNPLGGWYMSWLSYGNVPVESVTGEGNNPYIEEPLFSLDSEGINLHGLSLEANMRYNPSSAFTVGASLAWQPQNGETGYFNGYDRPELILNADIGVKPISPLTLKVGFDSRSKRSCYSRARDMTEAGNTVIDGQTSMQLIKMNLKALNMLNFLASWDFTKDFSVWLQADNLLNSHVDYLPSQPLQGIVVVAGLKYLF